MKNLLVICVIGFTVYYIYSGRNIKNEVEKSVEEKKTISPPVITVSKSGEQRTTESAIVPSSPTTSENIEKNEIVHSVEPTDYDLLDIYDEMKNHLENGGKIVFSEKDGDERLSDFIWNNYGETESDPYQISINTLDDVWSFLMQQGNLDFLEDLRKD